MSTLGAFLSVASCRLARIREAVWLAPNKERHFGGRLPMAFVLVVIAVIVAAPSSALACTTTLDFAGKTLASGNNTVRLQVDDCPDTDPTTGFSTFGFTNNQGVDINHIFAFAGTTVNVNTAASNVPSDTSGAKFTVTPDDVGGPNVITYFDFKITTLGTSTTDTITVYAAVNDIFTNPNSTYNLSDTVPATRAVQIHLINLPVAATPSTVTSVSPNAGPTGGTTSVVITGTNFTGTTGVQFGAATASSFTVNSATQITAVAPLHAAGTVDITVTNGTTSAITSADNYTYAAAPTVTSVSPTSTAANATRAITITGTNFTPSATVTVGGTAATSVNFSSATQLTATAPSKGAGPYDVVVTTAGGSSATSGADQLTYVAAPTAGAVSATVAPNSTNNPISLSLGGGTATSVAVSSAASHGTATPSGTSITYTPTPGYSGPDSFAYTASNIGGTSAPATVTITVSAPTITLAPTTLPAATVGAAYSQTITASGGTSTYAYTATAGALPAGLTLSSGGVLSGTPTAGGTFNVTVTATDSGTGSGAPFTGSRAYTLTVAPPTIAIAPTTLPAATVGVAYSQTITASGGTSTYAYAVTAGALPAGLTLSSGGTLSGTPTAAGSFNITVTATDSSTGTGAPFTGSRAYTLTVGAPTIAIAPTTLPSATVGTAYSQTLTASGGTSTYSFAVAAGALPPGLLLSGGVLSGTPTAGGSFSFTVTATDSSTGSGAPFTGGRSYTLAVGAATAPTASSFTFGTTVAYDANATSIDVSGHVTGTTTGYSVVSGTTTGGGSVSISSAGLATYAPATGFRGSDTFQFIATNSGSDSAAATVTVTVGNPTFAASVPVNTGTVGTAYSQQVTVTGGKAPYGAFSATGLPTGMTISSTGLISGTPTANATFAAVVVTATDSSTGTGPFTGTAPAFTITIAAATAPTASSFTFGATVPYDAGGTSIDVSGHVTGTTTGYSVGSATTPGGGSVSISGAGLATYTPATGFRGSDTFQFTATNAGSDSAAATVTVTVGNPTFAASVPVNTGTVGTAYSQQVTVTGGKAPFSAFSATGLPTGLTISSTGLISGTPTATGAFAAVAVTATDSSNGTGPFTGTAPAFTITIAAATAPTASSFTVGTTVAYDASATSIGVSGHVTGTTTGYSVVSGTTTGGGSVSISSAGLATYTPATGFRGADTFQFIATNAGSNASPATVTVNVGNPTFAASVPVSTGTVGTAYSQQVTVTGGKAPYGAFSTTGLPTGLTISSTGLISGTPTATGTFAAVAVVATDSSTAPFTGTAPAFTITIAAATPPTASSFTFGTTVAYDASATSIDVSGHVTGTTTGYSVGSATTTGGGSVSISGAGLATYTPATGFRGSDTFQFIATNAGSDSAAATVTLTVGNPTFAASVSVNTGTVGTAYSQQVTVTGGKAPYGAFSATGLPTGLTISSTGLISGTPTANATFAAVVVTTTDSSTAPFTGTAPAFTITIAAATAPTASSFTFGATVPYDAGGTSIDVSGHVTGTTTGYSVVSGTTTGGGSVGISSAGLATYTPATGFRGTDTFQFIAVNSGSASSAATVTVTVGNPTFTVTLPAPTGTLGLGYNLSGTPVTMSGGKAPYSAFSATGLPAGLDMSPSGVISGTPTATCSCTVTVQATDSSTGTGPFTSTASVPLSVTGTALTTAVAVPATSVVKGSPITPFTPITASGGNGSIAFAITSGTLPAGLSIATATGAISGTPTIASAQTTYTVTATDNSKPKAQTSSKTFSLTVNAPAPTVTAISPNTGLTTGGTAVTLTGTDFTGATGVTIGGVAATSVTVVSATSINATTPAGTSGTAGVVVTTPSGANAANTLFTYTSPVVTVTALSPATGASAGGTSVTITGTAFTRATVVKFGTANATSFTVTGPTSITAVSPAGAVGPVHVTVTAAGVTSPTGSSDIFTFTGAPVAQPVTAIAPPNGGSFTITPVLSGGPATSVAIARPPRHGAATTSRTTITYTPALGFTGTDTFTYTATNAQGTSAPATITVTVAKATTAIALTAPTLSAVFGVPVALTANVVGSAPTGTITFKEGTRALGIVRLSGTTATLAVASLSVGTHVFVASYSGDANNLAATSQVLSIAITGRPNPALNADVVGLVTAEVSTATRFGQTQINNTFHRLEELHDEEDGADAPKADREGPPQTSGRGGRTGGGARSQPNAEDPQQADASPAAFGGAPVDVYGALGNGPRGNGVLASAAQQGYISGDLPTTIRPDSQSQTGRAFQALSGMAIPATFAALNKRGDLPFHLWFAGAVDYGNLGGDGSTGNRFVYNNSFTTSGLTFGADRRFTSKLKAGVAVGVGFDHTAVGTDGTKSDARSYNATLYASYRFLPHTYFDAIAGYGRIGFNLDRWSTDGNVMLNGTRKGSDVFGSLVLTHDARWGAWRVSPYSRLDVVRVDLDAYNEIGSDIWALHYNDLETPTISAVVGTRLGYTIPVSWGTLTPMVRMEYSHALTGTYSQTLSYVDLPGTNYLISGLPIASNLFTGGISMRATSTGGFSAELEYLLSGSTDQFSGREVRASAKQAF